MGSETPAPNDDISLEAVFDLLSNGRCRLALACLSEHRELTLADLAERSDANTTES